MCKEETKSLLGEDKLISKYGGIAEKKEELERTSKRKEFMGSEKRADWLIVLASFLCICVLDGTMYSFGEFLEPLVAEMKQSRGTISIAGSVQVAMSAFVAPLAGYLVKKKGARTICFAGAVTASFGLLLASFGSNLVGIYGGLSLLTGVGFGLMYIPAVVVVAETFTTKRSLAVGFALCGAGAGQIGMAPLVNFLVENWGWRVGLQVLACVTIGCIGLGLLMKKRKRDVGGHQEGYEELAEIYEEEPCETKSITSKKHFMVFLVVTLADALAVMALYIPYSYLRPVAEAKGVASHISAILISSIGLGSVSGRLLAGWMSDQPWCHPLFLTRAVISFSCSLPFLLAWVDHLWMFIGLCMGFGFLTGKWIAATSPLIVSLLDIENLSQAFGLLTAVRGVASMVSPPLAGVLVEISSNPLHALYLSGILLMISGIIYSLAVWMFKRKEVINDEYQKILT